MADGGMNVGQEVPVFVTSVPVRVLPVAACARAPLDEDTQRLQGLKDELLP